MADKVRDRRQRGWSWFDNEVMQHYGSQLGPYGISTYMALLIFADSKSHTCFPSLQQLAEMTSMSRRQVMRSLKQLAGLKLIAIKHRTDVGQEPASNLYTILTPGGSDYQSLRGDSESLGSDYESPHVVTTSHLGSDYQSPELDSFNKTHKTRPNKTRAPVYRESFEIFWKAYPRKIGKDKAYPIFLKLNPDKDLLAIILAAIEQQKTLPQWQNDGGQYIPHPATWLNQGRWKDEISSTTSHSWMEIDFGDDDEQQR